MNCGGGNLTLKKEMQSNMEHPVMTKADPSYSGRSQQRSKKTHVLQDKIYFDFKSRFHSPLNPLSYLRTLFSKGNHRAQDGKCSVPISVGQAVSVVFLSPSKKFLDCTSIMPQTTSFQVLSNSSFIYQPVLYAVV
jgi:hypothetical protein